MASPTGMPRGAHSGAARAIVLCLASLAAARTLAALLPSEHLWSLNFTRFVPRAFAITALAMAWVALAPAVGVPRRRPFALAPGRPFVAFLSCAAVLVAMEVFLRDRAGFVGDFALRQGMVTESGDFLKIFPQALPLDVALHQALPQAISAITGAAPELVVRATGLIEAVALAAVAARFAAVLQLEGPAGFAVTSIVAFGGYASLYSGYGKPTTEVLLCVLAAGVFGIELLLRGTGAWPFAIAVSAGLALHRAALPLVAVWLAVVGLWLTTPASSRRRGLGTRLALAAPLAVFAALAPRLWTIVSGYDVSTNFASGEVRHQGGPLRAAFSALRLMDDANVLLLHAPLAPLALMLPRRWSRVEARVLAALALSFLPALFFVHGTLGPFRDYDALGGAGAAFALASAWVVGVGMREHDSAWRLAPGIAAGVVAPLLTLMLSQHSLERGFARAETFLSQSPRRTPEQRIATLDYIGLRAMQAEEYDRAEDAFRRMAAEAPGARALKLWGTAAAIVGNDREALTAFADLVRRDSTDAMGWYGAWMSAVAVGDTAMAHSAAAYIGRLRSDGPEMARVVAYFDHYPRLLARVPRGAFHPPPARH